MNTMTEHRNSIMHFWIKPQVLFDDVYARTSFIGKSLITQTGDTLIDQLSFSHDEAYTLFAPFAYSAFSDIYLHLSKWNKNLERGYLSYAYEPKDDVNEIKGTKNNLYFALWCNEKSTHALGALGTAIYEAMVFHIIFDWLRLVKPDLSNLYYELYVQRLTAIDRIMQDTAWGGIGQVSRHIF